MNGIRLVRAPYIDQQYSKSGTSTTLATLWMGIRGRAVKPPDMHRSVERFIECINFSSRGHHFNILMKHTRSHSQQSLSQPSLPSRVSLNLYCCSTDPSH